MSAFLWFLIAMATQVSSTVLVVYLGVVGAIPRSPFSVAGVFGAAFAWYAIVLSRGLERRIRGGSLRATITVIAASAATVVGLWLALLVVVNRWGS